MLVKLDIWMTCFAITYVSVCVCVIPILLSTFRTTVKENSHCFVDVLTIYGWLFQQWNKHTTSSHTRNKDNYYPREKKAAENRNCVWKNPVFFEKWLELLFVLFFLFLFFITLLHAHFIPFVYSFCCLRLAYSFYLFFSPSTSR